VKFKGKTRKSPTVVTGQRSNNTTLAERYPGPMIPTDLRQWNTIDELAGGGMDDDIHEYLEAKKAMDLAEQKKKLASARLMRALEKADVEEVAVGAVRVKLVGATTIETLDREALIRAGVTEKQLKKGTVEHDRAGYVKITPPRVVG
jgi:hypothetical protein